MSDTATQQFTPRPTVEEVQADYAPIQDGAADVIATQRQEALRQAMASESSDVAPQAAFNEYVAGEPIEETDVQAQLAVVQGLAQPASEMQAQLDAGVPKAPEPARPQEVA